MKKLHFMRRTPFPPPPLLSIRTVLCFGLSLLILLRLSSPSSTPTPADLILIDCGSSSNFTDGDDRVWSGDEGSSHLLPASVRATSPDSPQGPIPAVPFSTARISSDSFTYSIPVSSSELRYFVRLYFYPSDYGDLTAPEGIFDVSSGPHTLLKSFSPHAYAKALNLDYIVREYSLNVSSTSPGWLNITFTPSPNVTNSYALVNGIELVPMPNIFSNKQYLFVLGTPVQYDIQANVAVETMYRLNVGGKTLQLSEDSGNLYRMWLDDSNYIAGAAFGITFDKMDNVTVGYTSSVPEYIAPVDVYETARSMPWFDDSINLNYNMSWILTVDPGFYYLVRLHFCEIQYPFTLPNQRVFTIYVNNRSAVQDFDVISRSNGLGVPVYYDCVVVIPEGDKQVDLWVSLQPFVKFNPQYTNVILNGLEVFKLSNFFGSLAGPQPSMPQSASSDPTKAVLDVGSKCPNKGGQAAAMGGFCGAVGALLLMGLLLYIVYHLNWQRGDVGSGFHSCLPLVMSKNAFTGSGHFTLVKIGEKKVEEPIVAWKGGDDDMGKKAGCLSSGNETVALETSEAAGSDDESVAHRASGESMTSWPLVADQRGR